MKNKKIEAIVTSAILLALSIVLSYIKVFQLPFGGSVTVLSMLPICIVSIKYGLGWGLGTGFCLSVFQLLQDGPWSWGLTSTMLVGSLFLDYIIAFTVLGLAGMFRKHGTVGAVAGIAVACVLRFLSHFVSGIVLWANLEEFVAFGETWVNHPVLYSLCYNGSFMLAETVFTIIGAVVLFSIPQTKKIFAPAA